MRQNETERRDSGRIDNASAERAEAERREDQAAMPRQEHGSAGDARWQEIKSRFVDDPAAALAAADDLVRQAVEEKIQKLREGHEELRARRADDVAESESPDGTEDMRNRLIRYQAYYESLSGVTSH